MLEFRFSVGVTTREGYSFLLSFYFEEFSFIAISRLAAAIVDGRYSKKIAVRMHCRQNFFASLVT